jgi:phosphoesterase RecJ-like protein
MEELIRLIEGAERIALISHVHPDGDAVGSLVGMHLGLTQLGKEVHACLVDGVPQIFRFLVGTDAVTQELPEIGEVDLCIILDTQDSARTGLLPEIHTFAEAGKLGNIDHHPKGDLARLAQAFYRDTDSASCAELCYQTLSRLGVKFTPDISTALLTGMYTDTGGFQFDNTTNQTLELSAELMRRGGRLQKIASNISHHKSVPALKLMGIAMERIKVSLDGRCCYSVLTYKDLRDCKASPEDVEGIIGAINSLPETQFCLLLMELIPGELRGSVRTSDGHTTNVSKIAKLLGGGGHPKASGFTLNNLQIKGDAQSGWRIERFLVN